MQDGFHLSVGGSILIDEVTLDLFSNVSFMMLFHHGPNTTCVSAMMRDHGILGSIDGSVAQGSRLYADQGIQAR